MIGLLRRGLLVGGVMLLVLTARLGGVKGGVDECRAVALVQDAAYREYFWMSDPYHEPVPLLGHVGVGYPGYKAWSERDAVMIFIENGTLLEVPLNGHARTLTTDVSPSASFVDFVGWLPNGRDYVTVGYGADTQTIYYTRAEGREFVPMDGSNGTDTYFIDSTNLKGQFTIMSRRPDQSVDWVVLDTARAEPAFIALDLGREQRWGLWWAADGASLVTLWEIEGQREIERLVFADGSRQSLFVPYEWTVQFIDYTGEAVFLRNLNNPATLYRVTWDGAPPQPFMERGDSGPYVVGWRDERTVLVAPVTPFMTNMVPVPLQWLDTVTGAVETLPFEAAYFGPWDAEYQRLYVGLLNETGQQATMAAWRDDLQQLTTLSTYRRDGMIHPSPCGDTYMLVDGLPGNRRTQWGYTFRTGVTALPQGMDLAAWLTLPAYEWHAGRLVVGGMVLMGVGGLLGVVRRRVRGVGW